MDGRSTCLAGIALLSLLAVYFFALHGPASERPARPASLLIPLSPVGTVRQEPAEIRWRAVAGAGRYDVEIAGKGRETVWKGSAAESSIPFPAEAIARLLPGEWCYSPVRSRRGRGGEKRPASRAVAAANPADSARSSGAPTSARARAIRSGARTKRRKSSRSEPVDQPRSKRRIASGSYTHGSHLTR